MNENVGLEDQRLMLLEAQMHLEMVDENMSASEANDRRWAAIYLIQRVVSGVVPKNWDQVLDQVRRVDATNELLAIAEHSKRRYRTDLP